MDISSKFIHLIRKICRYTFGEFEIEEFKKFLKMGAIFALIIGIYWTLRPLKDSIFIQLVDKLHLPYAKTASVIALLPLVMMYTRLLEKTSREKMLMILPAFYGSVILIFSVLMLFIQFPCQEMTSISSLLMVSRWVIGYSWYLFVESFGSLVVALFWAFATDTTDSVSAKRGFPLVVAIGQIGGIISPFLIGGLPHRLQLSTDSLSIALLGALTLFLIPLIRYFLKTTPQALMKPFQEETVDVQEKHEETGFLEGLKLMLKHPYLLGIFASNFIYEVIITIFDFNFKIQAGTHYTGVALSNYLSVYGSSVNIVSLSCLLFGISNITQRLGVGMALSLMPIIVGLALCGFLGIDNLQFLFALMVGSKAINYALNGPALKQLYIPTTSDVRFKAQAWIETFGSRASKEAGSVFNMLLSPLQSAFGIQAGRAYYLMLSGGIGFPLLVLWFFVAIFLGKTYAKAIGDKKTIC